MTTRLQAAVPTFLSRLLNVNVCSHHAPGLALLQSSATQSALIDATCRQDVDHFGERSVMGSASAHRHSILDTRRVNSQACMHHVKKQSSHIHTSASEGTSLNGDTSVSIQRLEKLSCTVPQPHKPSILSQQNAPKKRSPDAVQHTCNANDSPFAPASESKHMCFEALHPPTPAQAPHITAARRKGQKKAQSAAAALELLHQKVSLLELEQVSLCDASILRKSRAFKSTSFEHLAAVLKVLKDLLGSSEKACRALAMNPGLLLHPSELLEQKLKVLADFGIREEVVRKLSTTTQNVLTQKVESLHTKLGLLEEIGLTLEARNRLLRLRPMILRSSYGIILCAFNFFKSLGMSWKEILRSLWMNGLNVRNEYDFFQQLGFTVNEFTRFTRAGMPQLAIETFQAKIKFFKDQGFSDSDVHVLILRNPNMLRLTDKALKSKLDFLICEQNYDVADIVKYPVCLKYSLQGRLIPRFKALKEKGISKVYALSTILSCNDLRFQKLGRRGKGQ